LAFLNEDNYYYYCHFCVFLPFQPSEFSLPQCILLMNLSFQWSLHQICPEGNSCHGRYNHSRISAPMSDDSDTKHITYKTFKICLMAMPYKLYFFIKYPMWCETNPMEIKLPSHVKNFYSRHNLRETRVG
jgi:hypothetical protein